MRIFKNNVNLFQDKFTRILQILISGAIAVDYSLSDTINGFMGGWFYIIPAGLILVAVIIPVKSTVSLPARQILIFLYFGLSAVLLVLLTNVFGPYFQLLILLLFVAIIWFGTRGLLYGLLMCFGIIAAALFVEISQGDIWVLTHAGLYIAGLSTLGILFERVTVKHRNETQKHQKLSQDYNFERTRLLSLINSMADAVIATEKNGKITLYNGAALDLLNTNESLQGKNLNNFLQLKDEKGEEVDLLGDTYKKQAPITRDDVYFIAQDGSRVYLHISVSSISSVFSGSSSIATGFIMILRDITKQKTLDEQRDEFISVVSHELRTPIAIAEANISTAMMPKFTKNLNKEGQKLLNQAHENVVFLSNLINDLHLLAQAEQGNYGLQMQEVNPEAFIRNIEDNYKKQIEEKGLSFEVNIEGKLPLITTSNDALKEIMQNLITNSIKYTEEGSIKLEVFTREETNEIVFSVTDSGIGISVSDQKHIFEKFYRSEDYRTRKNGGTGLGLYIIKRLGERLGGRLWFESKLNKGSTFYFALPLDGEQ